MSPSNDSLALVLGGHAELGRASGGGAHRAAGLPEHPAKERMNIVEMTIGHYDGVLDLLRRTPGVTVRDADSREATKGYLERNPALSFVALADGKVVGCAMCGHDGRRGYLQHVVVDPAFRGQGLAHRMVTRCLDALGTLGIRKTHIDVFRANDLANACWTRRGWTRRDDLDRYSYNRSHNENA